MKWIIRSLIGVFLLITLNTGICAGDYIIRDDPTGCDCENIGLWSPATLTCTLVDDVYDTIEIDSDSITLNGNGHYAVGIYIYENRGYIIKDLISDHISIYSITASNNNGLITGNSVKTICIEGVKNVIITDNVISFNEGTGLSLIDCSDFIVRNNTVKSNLGFGIFSGDGCRNNSFRDNKIHGNKVGILLKGTNGEKIINNNIRYNDNKGICCEGASHSYIHGNIIFQDGCGVYLKDHPDYRLENNEIIDNIIQSNEIGIYCDSQVCNNRVYQNCFLSNIIQNAIDDSDYTETNKWNSNSIGNYWDDFNDPSEGCSDTDHDNICDSFYTIPGSAGAIDRYPLVSDKICLCNLYDTNGINGIQKDEVVNAINDYLITAEIDKEAAISVLNCYYEI